MLRNFYSEWDEIVIDWNSCENEIKDVLELIYPKKYFFPVDHIWGANGMPERYLELQVKCYTNGELLFDGGWKWDTEVLEIIKPSLCRIAEKYDFKFGRFISEQDGQCAMFVFIVAEC